MLKLHIALLAVLAGSASGATFDFDNVSSPSLPFSDTEGAITATFTAVPDVIDASSDGNIVSGEITSQGIDPNGAVGQFVEIGFGNYLDVTFDRDVTAATVDYQVLDLGGYGSFFIAANENGTRVGSVDVEDAGANSYGHAGAIGFEGVNFNEIYLEDLNHPFDVDNLEVNAVPEPSTLGLFLITGCGLLSLGLRQSRPSLPR